MEERLLADLGRLEAKMRRIEDAYDDIAADIRLGSLQSALEEMKVAAASSGGGEVVYEGDQPVAVGFEEAKDARGERGRGQPAEEAAGRQRQQSNFDAYLVGVGV